MDTITRHKEIKEFQSEEVLNFVKWANNQPQPIKTLANKFPATNRYTISDEAPYGNRIPHRTIIELYAYHSDGTVTVLIREEQKSKDRISFEKIFCETNMLDYDTIKKRDMIETIDPKWLTPIK